MIQRFRKLPVVIEAVQYTGRNFFEIAHFLGEGDLTGNNILQTTDRPVIHTSEGDMTASAGDWIIRGTKGEFYPCKPDIFTAIYEKAEEEES